MRRWRPIRPNGGYFGTFTTHENAELPYVVHHQEGRSRPSEPTDAVRLYQLDGDVLRLGVDARAWRTAWRPEDTSTGS